MNEQSIEDGFDDDRELPRACARQWNRFCAARRRRTPFRTHWLAPPREQQPSRGGECRPRLDCTSGGVVPAARSPRLALGIAASLALVALAAAVLGYSLAQQSEIKIARQDSLNNTSGEQDTTRIKDRSKSETMNKQHDQRPNESTGGSALMDGRSAPDTIVGLSRDGGAPSDGIEPTTAFGGVSPRGGTAQPRGLGDQPRGGTARFAGASPSRWMSIAADATVLISTGGNDPIELAVRQPWSNKTTLHVWDWSKSSESRPLDASADRSMVLAPDGKKAVTNDGRVVDTTTSEITRLENFEGDVYRVKFSRDGRVLVLMIHGSGNQGTARLLEFPSGKKIREIADIFPHMFVAGFDHDSKQVVLIGADLKARRFETATGKELAKYEPAHSNSVRAVAISNDGKYVVSSGPKNETFLWDAESAKLLHKLDVAQQPNVINEVYSLEFSPDDKLLAGGGAQNLVLWNTGSGTVESIYPTSSGGAVHIRFDKEGKQMTTVHDFHGARGENGEDLLVYPRVHEWSVESK